MALEQQIRIPIIGESCHLHSHSDDHWYPITVRQTGRAALIIFAFVPSFSRSLMRWQSPPQGSHLNDVFKIIRYHDPYAPSVTIILTQPICFGYHLNLPVRTSFKNGPPSSVSSFVGWLFRTPNSWQKCLMSLFVRSLFLPWLLEMEERFWGGRTDGEMELSTFTESEGSFVASV